MQGWGRGSRGWEARLGPMMPMSMHRSEYVRKRATEGQGGEGGRRLGSRKEHI